MIASSAGEPPVDGEAGWFDEDAVARRGSREDADSRWLKSLLLCSAAPTLFGSCSSSLSTLNLKMKLRV